MTVESTNSPSGESDSPQPSNDLSKLAEIGWDDEPDDQANASAETSSTEPDSETGEATSQETEDQPDSAQNANESGEQPEAAAADVTIPDNAMVTLKNGDKVKFSDLIASPMFQADYSRKTQDLSNRSRALEAQANRIQSVIGEFTNFLAQQVPAAPDPALAYTDPNAYTRQKAMHDAALAQVTSIIERGSHVKSLQAEMNQEQFDVALSAANARLVEARPLLKDSKARQDFNKQAWDAATHFGFSAEENNRTTDHRMMLMAYYANLGLKAEQARQTAQKKVVSPPQTTPAKRSAPSSDPQFLRNQEGMRRLAKTGRMQDAVLIDFE